MAFFLTDVGQKVVAVSGGLVSSCGYIYYYVYNTYFVDHYKDATELYHKKVPVPVPASIVEVFHDVNADLKLSKEAASAINLYSGNGFDYFLRGSLYRFGELEFFNKAAMGVPLSLSWSEKEDFSQKNIFLKDEPLNWVSADGKRLRENVLLSENAKKYALASQICRLTYPDPLVLGSFSALSILASILYSKEINRRFNLHAAPRKIRFVVYGLVGTFNWILFICLKDMYTCVIEGYVDQKIAGISPAYIEGGEEFYRKSLEKNIALRALYGSRGSKYFTAKGNLEVLLRTPQLSLSQRHDYFFNQKEELTADKK